VQTSILTRRIPVDATEAGHEQSLNAIISVSDPANLESLGRALGEMGANIYATGGTKARMLFLDGTLADLYDPNTMPPELTRAHRTLDKAVDAAYRKRPFDTELSRVEHLFSLYRQLTAPLLSTQTKRKSSA
jgi:hypothetical protein